MRALLPFVLVSQVPCRSNAALLFLLRDEPGDRVQAEVLLEQAVPGDPTRVRAAYGLARLRRRGAVLLSGRLARPGPTARACGAPGPIGLSWTGEIATERVSGTASAIAPAGRSTGKPGPKRPFARTEVEQ